MAALFAFLTLCLAAAEKISDTAEALASDDQCASDGCAVNALQLHVKDVKDFVPGVNAPEELAPELMEWHTDYYGHAPRADISASNYKSLMLNISVQQKAIMALWNRSVKLGEEVDALVKQVEHDSGLKVKDWVVLTEEDVEESSREHTEGNQPREALVKKWIRSSPDCYLDQEMGQVFIKLNSKGKLVAAAGTLMSKNPIPLKLQKQTKGSLAETDPTEPLWPGDHIGIGDELWRSVIETITNIHTAQKSANDLESHIHKINKMIVDFNEGKLIPNEDSGIGEH